MQITCCMSRDWLKFESLVFEGYFLGNHEKNVNLLHRNTRFIAKFLIFSILSICTHLCRVRRGDVITTSLCTSQQRHRYVPNETPNDVSVERRLDVSVVRLHDVLLERCDYVLKGRNNDVPSVRLHNVSNKSQMKHPTTSQWYVSTTSHYYVPTTSPVSPK